MIRLRKGIQGKIRNAPILMRSTEAEVDTPETATAAAWQQSSIVLESMESEAKIPHWTNSIQFSSFFSKYWNTSPKIIAVNLST